jgi:hypothetical protein
MVDVCGLVFVLLGIAALFDRCWWWGGSGKKTGRSFWGQLAYEWKNRGRKEE